MAKVIHIAHSATGASPGNRHIIPSNGIFQYQFLPFPRFTLLVSFLFEQILPRLSGRAVMQFTWPPNDFTLMWLQIAVGFTGALTFVHFLRSLGRKFGTIPDLRAYFSPRGGCQDSLVQELQKARKEILVQAYSFTAD